MAKITTNLSNSVSQLVDNLNSLSNLVGDLTLLNTVQDSDLVGSINEVLASITGNDSDISSLYSSVATNASDILLLDSAIGVNTSDISTNTSGISSLVSTVNSLDLDTITGVGNTTSNNITIGSINVGGTVTLTAGSSNWTFTISGNNVYIAYGGTNKMKLDTSGNLQVAGDIETSATIS